MGVIAALDLAAVVAAAVFDGQRTTRLDADDVAEVDTLGQVAVELMSVEVDGHGHTIADVDVVAECNVLYQFDIGTIGDSVVQCSLAADFGVCHHHLGLAIVERHTAPAVVGGEVGAGFCLAVLAAVA